MASNEALPAVVMQHLDALLDKRTYPKTLCPSEVARALSTAELQDINVSSWRNLMPRLRSLCFTLRDEGKLEILQRGQVQTKSQTETRGPIRIRKVKA